MSSVNSFNPVQICSSSFGGYQSFLKELSIGSALTLIETSHEGASLKNDPSFLKSLIITHLRRNPFGEIDFGKFSLLSQAVQKSERTYLLKYQTEEGLVQKLTLIKKDDPQLIVAKQDNLVLETQIFPFKRLIQKSAYVLGGDNFETYLLRESLATLEKEYPLRFATPMIFLDEKGTCLTTDQLNESGKPSLRKLLFDQELPCTFASDPISIHNQHQFQIYIFDYKIIGFYFSDFQTGVTEAKTLNPPPEEKIVSQVFTKVQTGDETFTFLSFFLADSGKVFVWPVHPNGNSKVFETGIHNAVSLSWGQNASGNDNLYVTTREGRLLTFSNPLEMEEEEDLTSPGEFIVDCIGGINAFFPMGVNLGEESPGSDSLDSYSG